MFKRGFKTRCEELSLEKRRQFGLRPFDPLDPSLLASALSVTVWTIDDVPTLSKSSKRILLEHDPYGWSAMTLRHESKTITILNSSHGPARQSSDLMHELSHLILNHLPGRVDISPNQEWILHTYDRGQEEEASWLSGCLLLSRPALLMIKKRRMSTDEAIKQFGVTETMLQYRLNVSGVNRQLSSMAIRKYNRVR